MNNDKHIEQAIGRGRKPPPKAVLFPRGSGANHVAQEISQEEQFGGRELMNEAAAVIAPTTSNVSGAHKMKKGW